MSGKAAVVAVLAVGLAGPLLAAPKGPQTSPLAGTWVANFEKSKRRPSDQFQSATLQFVVVGDTVSVTHGGINAAGKEESGTVVLKADGKEQSVPGQEGVTTVTRWAGSRVLRTIAKTGGKQVGEQSYSVSGDGKTLTARVSGTDASGVAFDHELVFDRQ
jgi:hypothetical protein